MRFIRDLLGISRDIVAAGAGLRPGSGAASLFFWLFLFFFVLGLGAVLSGIGFNKLDLWIDRQLVWIEPVATLLMRVLFGAVMLLCLGVVVVGLYGRLPARLRATFANQDRPATVDPGVAAPIAPMTPDTMSVAPVGGRRKRRQRHASHEAPVKSEKPIGWAIMIVALVIGYFAYVGAFRT